MSSAGQPRAIDRLLTQAFEAISRGDRTTATALAQRVLVLDQGNAEAEDLLNAPTDEGEIRRLTIMFVDMVDSTALSTQVEPEVYRTVVGRYRSAVIATVEHYEGHLASTKGDGLLAFFGHPLAHEDDVRRAVLAGLDVTREVAALRTKVRRQFGFDIDVRVGIHRGIVYLDLSENDVYGFAANLAARLCSLAEPGTVAVSESIERLAGAAFELEARLPRTVKGVAEPVRSFRVLAEREMGQMRAGKLIGRDCEIQYLRQRWAQARNGRLTRPGVFLRGDAGLGKSRLAWTAVNAAMQSHAVVLTLVGSPFHTEVGLRPVRRLLERRCDITRASDPAVSLTHLKAEVATRLPARTDMVPLLAPVLGITTGYESAAVEGRKLHEQVMCAVRDYLLACVRDTPALIVAEDMHWFDDDTAQVVRSLLDADLGGHVMVVVTSRHDVALPDTTEVFELQPLSRDDADRLIMSLHPEVTAEQRRAVRRRGDGIPLYIEEIVATVKELPADASSSAAVPDSLYEALIARLGSSTTEVRVAGAAALAGTRFDRKLLHSVIDLTADEIDRAIDQLVIGRVLRQLESDTWSFRHELMREVAAELSPPSVRRRLHGLIADVLAAPSSVGNPDWPLIARHNTNAERFADAASAYAQAAAIAAQRGALSESRNYFTQAIGLVERAPPGVARDKQETTLRLERGRLVYAAEGAASPNAANDYQCALELSSADLHSNELFATLAALYAYYAMRAELDRVQTVLESIRLNLAGREWFAPFNNAGFGMLAWYRGEFDDARVILEAACTACNDEGARATESVWFMANEGVASIYTHLALARYVQGDLRGAEAELRRTEIRCEELEFPQGPFSLAYGLHMETLIRVDAGQFDRAATAAGRLTALGEKHGFDSWALAGAAQQGFVSALEIANADEPDIAMLAERIAALCSFVELWHSLGVIALITSYEALLARLQVCAGQHGAARDRVDAALHLAQRTGMHYYDAELLRVRAHTQDDASLRHTDLVEAAALARRQNANIHELRCAIDDFEMGGQGSREALVASIERFPADGGWPVLAHARTLLLS